MTIRAQTLVAQPAQFDGHCATCGQIILGADNHPLDTVDHILKVNGAWSHADCIEEQGREVIRL